MLRLILLLLLALVSLLTFFKAPAYHLWLVAIMVSEYSLIFIAVTLVLLLVGWWWPGKYLLAGTLTGIIALLFFCYPIISAYLVGRGLTADMNKVLGSTAKPVAETPFSFLKLFKGVNVPVAQSFTYVTYPDTALTLDYYPANAQGLRPCVLVIHGGSWSSGDSKQLPQLNAQLAQAGYQVVSINYRLAPKWQSPAPVADVEAAISYLHQHAARLKIDTNRMVLLGRSAGAQIALLAAYTLQHKGICGVIDFYGPADMVWGYSLPAPKLIMDSRRVMANYLGGYYPSVPQHYQASSPIEYVEPNTVPTLLIHGANDVLVAYGHSYRLDKKLQQNGVIHYWLRLPWATHGFDYHLNGPGGQLSTYAVERFLATVTR